MFMGHNNIDNSNCQRRKSLAQRIDTTITNLKYNMKDKEYKHLVVQNKQEDEITHDF